MLRFSKAEIVQIFDTTKFKRTKRGREFRPREPVLTLFTGPYCVMGLLNGDKESFCALLGNAKLIMVYHTAPMDMAWMAPVGVGAMEMPW